MSQAAVRIFYTRQKMIASQTVRQCSMNTKLIQRIVFVSLTPSGSPRNDNKYQKIVETLISEE